MSVLFCAWLQINSLSLRRSRSWRVTFYGWSPAQTWCKGEWTRHATWAPPLSSKRWRFAFAVRETGVSRQGGPIEGPPKTPHTSVFSPWQLKYCSWNIFFFFYLMMIISPSFLLGSWTRGPNGTTTCPTTVPRLLCWPGPWRRLDKNEYLLSINE